MSKERQSFSLDPDVYEYLGQEHVNASGLVNKLVRQHMNGGVDEDVIREFRKEQLRGEIESAKKTLETKERELQRLEQADQAQANRRNAAVDELLDEIADGKAVFPPQHPKVKEVAQVFDSHADAVEAINARADERNDISREVINE